MKWNKFNGRRLGRKRYHCTFANQNRLFHDLGPHQVASDNNSPSTFPKVVIYSHPRSPHSNQLFLSFLVSNNKFLYAISPIFSKHRLISKRSIFSYLHLALKEFEKVSLLRCAFYELEHILSHLKRMIISALKNSKEIQKFSRFWSHLDFRLILKVVEFARSLD